MIILAFLNDKPKVKPSAHLWQITAKEIPKHWGTCYSMPIAKPSKNAWIPDYINLLPIAN